MITLRPTAIPIEGGGWRGALVEDQQVVWTCTHYHANRLKQQLIPNGESHQQYPERRSARGCASVELSRRLEEERLACRA